MIFVIVVVIMIIVVVMICGRHDHRGRHDLYGRRDHRGHHVHHALSDRAPQITHPHGNREATTPS